MVKNRDVVYLGWPIASTYFETKETDCESCDLPVFMVPILKVKYGVRSPKFIWTPVHNIAVLIG